MLLTWILQRESWYVARCLVRHLGSACIAVHLDTKLGGMVNLGHVKENQTAGVHLFLHSNMHSLTLNMALPALRIHVFIFTDSKSY